MSTSRGTRRREGDDEDDGRRHEDAADVRAAVSQARRFVVAQTANILAYLGPRLKLVPSNDEARRARWRCSSRSRISSRRPTIRTIPSASISTTRTSGRPRRSARSRSSARASPKFLGYFESRLAHNGGKFFVGTRLSYVDLSAFQIVCGLSYAFPNAMAATAPNVPLLMALRDRVAARPNIAAYLASKRRIPFNEDGIFRHYAELDPKKAPAKGE